MYSKMLLWLAYLLLVNLGYKEINASINYSQLRDYVYIASDVKNYFRASSVLNIYNDKNSDASTMTTMFELSRAFSENNIFALSLKLSEVKKYFDYNKNQTSLPLHTITLNSQKDLDEFSNFAQNFSMSFNLWLVFFGESIDLLQFCKFPHKNLLNLAFNTKMLIKCQNEDVIKEWYSLFKDEVKVHEVAAWTRQNRFIKTNNQSMWKNRNSMEGIRMRIATIQRDGYVNKIDFNNKNATLPGLFGNVLRELSTIMNFTIDVVGSEQMFGHYYAESKNWSGVMGRLVSKEIDIGVAEFSRNKRRLEVVDFSVPLSISRFNMYVKRPNMTAIIWSSYVQIFNRRIWASNIFLMTFCSFVIAVMMSKLGKKNLLALISENCFYIWGIQCQQGLPEFPSATSLKLAFVSLFISSIVIHITYSATLTSFITIYEPSLPFSTEQEFLMHSSYNLSVFRGSIYHDSIQQSKHPIVKLMKKRLVNSKDLPTNMVEALHQVCTQKVVLYMNEIFVNKNSPRNPCSLMSIDTGRPDSQSFALVKNSPYKEIINFNIENFRAFGILKVLRNRFQQKTIILNSKYWPVSFWSIVPILIIFITGVCFAILMLICEYIHFFLKKERISVIKRIIS